MNGATHGIFCNDLVLPHECSKEFKAFRDAFVLELRPLSIVELMLVDRIVSASWKLKRVNRIEALVTDGYRQEIKKAQDEELIEHDSHFVNVLDPSKCDHISGAEAQAVDFVGDERAIERLGRHAQRLEMSIYRAMRELEKYRKTSKRSQSRTVSGGGGSGVYSGRYGRGGDRRTGG